MALRIQGVPLGEGASQILRLLEEAAKTEELRPYVVAIAGGSAAGKSELAARLKEASPSTISVLAMDNYYVNNEELVRLRRRDPSLNWAMPGSVDLNSFAKDLTAVIDGRAIEQPLYDFGTSDRVGRSLLLPTKILIAEGVFVMEDAIQELSDFAIFVDATEDVRLRRMLVRDQCSRQRSADEVKEYFETIVEPMHQRYIMPRIEQADIVVEFTILD